MENRSVGLPCPGDLNICHMKALVGLVLTGCLLKTAAFAGGGLSVTAFSWTRAHAGKLAFGRRLCTSQLTAQVERKDGRGSDRKILETAERTEPAKPWGDGGSGDNRLLQTLEFVIGSTFSSRLYVGGKELHVALPLPRPHDYPTWFPAILRLPQAVYDAAERGLDEGWITKAEDDSVFAIKYGVLRSEVRPLPDEDCEPCQRAKRMELEAAAARDLVNIDRNERSRRINTGYGDLSEHVAQHAGGSFPNGPLNSTAGLAVSSVLAYLAIDLDGGPLARFPAAFLAVLAYAFVESGKTGL